MSNDYVETGVKDNYKLETMRWFVCFILLTSFTISTSVTKWTIARVGIETVRTTSSSINTWIWFTNFTYKRWRKHISCQMMNNTHEIHNVDLEIPVDKYNKKHHQDEVHMCLHSYKDLVYKHDLIKFNYILHPKKDF